MIDTIGLYPSTALGRELGTTADSCPGYPPTSSRDNFPIFFFSLLFLFLFFPSPPPSLSFVDVDFSFKFTLSLPPGGSHLFSKLLHKGWEMGTLAPGIRNSHSGAENLPELTPWTTLCPLLLAPLVLMKVKALFNTQLWEMLGQILDSLADGVLRNNTIFLYLPSWLLKKRIQNTWIARHWGNEDS